MADKSMEDLNNLSARTEKKEVDTSKKLRVGIIGCGWIAETHIGCYVKHADVEIVAGADLVPGKAKALFEKYGITNAKTHYANHKEMLDDESLQLDAVSVCTYNRQHAEPTIYALKKGVHVMVEKPFTVTLEEAAECIRAEKESGKILSVGFQPRMDENIRQIKRIVESGELGDIYYVQTGGGRRRGIPTPYGTTFIEEKTAGIGAVGDLGCYTLDMVLNAIGYPKPLTVSGYRGAFFGKDPKYSDYPEGKGEEYAKLFNVDDFAAAFVRLEGGIILDFRIAWAMNIDSPCDTIILGTKGGLRIPSTKNWTGSIPEEMIIYHESAGLQVETKVPHISNKEWIFEKKIRTFIDACKENGPAPVPSAEILYNQAIIDGIVRSAELGREVEIVIPEI